MKNTQRGFIGLAIIVIIALAAIGGGTYVYTKQKEKVDSTESIDTTANMQKDLNEAKDDINASVGAKLVTSATVKIDSNGRPLPVLGADEKVAANLVAERYGSDPAYARKMIKVSLFAMGTGLQADASTIVSQGGSYAGVCDGAKAYFNTEVIKALNSDEDFQNELTAKMGITASSYRINELVCKSNDSAYVATIPLTLEDGTNTKLCMSSTGTTYGEANFTTLTCVKR
jgi:hypothetical protein